MEENESRADTVTRLQRLWQSEPERYWPALRASGLSAQEVWPNLPKHVPSGDLKKAGPKK